MLVCGEECSKNICHTFLYVFVYTDIITFVYYTIFVCTNSYKQVYFNQMCN